MSQHYVIVGLGNPGKKYETTRHNVGYIIVQALARKYGWSFKEEARFCAQVTKGKIGENTVHLVLPTTWMNKSGQAVQRYLNFYKLFPEQLIVVSDDADIPFGEMRFREKGSSGGHRGLESIRQHLGTTQYLRLKMGIGRGERQQELSDYVLEGFSQNEKDHLITFIQRGVHAIERVMSEDIAQVMNDVNIKHQPKG